MGPEKCLQMHLSTAAGASQERIAEGKCQSVDDGFMWDSHGALYWNDWNAFSHGFRSCHVSNLGRWSHGWRDLSFPDIVRFVDVGRGEQVHRILWSTFEWDQVRRRILDTNSLRTCEFWRCHLIDWDITNVMTLQVWLHSSSGNILLDQKLTPMKWCHLSSVNLVKS